MAGKIFVNYRRGDDPGFTQALFGRLEQSFSPEQLFMDVDGIAPGQDFAHVLEQQVSECDVLISVIGKGWLDARDEKGARRLDNPDDYVRIEIESAISQDKLVIPVLVGDAQMPRFEQLPETLRPLARRNAVRLTHERFRTDTQSLIESLQREVQGNRQPRSDRKQRRKARGRGSFRRAALGSGMALVLMAIVAILIWPGTKTKVEIAQLPTAPVQSRASPSASAPMAQTAKPAPPSNAGTPAPFIQSSSAPTLSKQVPQPVNAPITSPQQTQAATVPTNKQTSSATNVDQSSRATPPAAAIPEATVTSDSSQAGGLFTVQDMRRVRSIANEHKLEVLPPFKIERPDLKLPERLRKFVGIWASEIGFGSGIARHAMLIVTKVDAPTQATGYWVWGSPTAREPRQFPAGADPFEGNITGNQLTFRGQRRYGVTATLAPSDRLSIVQTRDSGQKAYITLNPVWRLVDAERSAETSAQSHHP
jgi:TIR domain